MPVLNFPDIIPDTFSYGLKFNVQINTSPTNGNIQTVELPGARFTASMTFEDLEPYEGRVLAAWLSELRGAAGRFLLWDLSHDAPRGTAAGTPIVSGAGQVGSTLNTSGWTPGTTLLKGDYIELENFETKIVTADTVADASGLMTISFSPPIKSPTGPADASSINIQKCKSQMLLTHNSVVWNTDNPGLLTNFRIECVEV